MLMILLKEIAKNSSYSIRKTANNLNIPEKILKDMQPKLENLGYIKRESEECGYRYVCTSTSCSVCCDSNQSFDSIKLTKRILIH